MVRFEAISALPSLYAPMMRSLKSATFNTSSVMGRLFVRSRTGAGIVAVSDISSFLFRHRDFVFAHQRSRVDDFARDFHHFLQAMTHARQVFLHDLLAALAKIFANVFLN